VGTVSHLECSETGERYEPGEVHGLSSAGSPLLVCYDLDVVADRLNRETLRHRREGLWRYHELLPVQKPDNRVSLGEVVTPLVPLGRLAPEGNVVVKDESRLPTGSFKARGLAVAVAMAKELGIGHLAIPTNGNAGAALAAYAARAGLRSTVFCAASTPAVNVAEAARHGATVHRVDGAIDECGRLVRDGVDTHGWFDCSTLKEPYRIEGKKTIGLELAEQRGWKLPDVIVYPTGGGTGLIGMWKAFAELEAMGWVDSKRPRMAVVQAAGCAPLVRAWQRGERHAERWPDPVTVAAGIAVPAAIGDFLVLDAVRASGGFAMAVDDHDILAARDKLAETEGLLVCPEGAATYAAYRHAVETGQIAPSDDVVLFNTASALKYPLAIRPSPHES
jgi:threonine synthase